jgi:hypothetical protein
MGAPHLMNAALEEGFVFDSREEVHAKALHTAVTS